MPGIQSFEAKLKDGESMSMDAADRATENVGDTEPHILLVDLK